MSYTVPMDNSGMRSLKRSRDQKLPGQAAEQKKGQGAPRDAGGGSPCGPTTRNQVLLQNARASWRQRGGRGVQKGLEVGIKHQPEAERRETAQGSSACSGGLRSVLSRAKGLSDDGTRT